MSIETPRSSSNQDSTRILTDFRSRLEKRWIEFDIATLNEASGMAMVRDMHPQYQSTKEAFDQAKGILGTLKTDAELKKALSGPTKLSAHIANIEKYIATLKAPERNKEYNRVLSNTLADIHALKQGLNGSPRTPDPVPVLAKKPEGTEESIPTLPGTQNLTNQALKPIEEVAGDIKKIALGAGATVAATGLVSEGGFKKVLAEGFTKMKDWVMSIFEGDGIFAKLFGDKKNMIAGMLDKLGIGLPLSSAEAGNVPEEMRNNYPSARYRATATVFAALVKDPTNPPIPEYLLDSSFQELPLSVLEGAYKSKNYTELYKLVPYISDTAKKKIALDQILSHIFDNKTITARVLDSSYRAQEKIQKGTNISYQSITVEKYFTLAGPSMSKIAAIPTAIASGGKALVSGMGVKDGQLQGVDEGSGELESYQFSNSETRKKYLIAILSSPEGSFSYTPNMKKEEFIKSIIENKNGVFSSLSDTDKEELKKEIQKLLEFGDNFTKLLTENGTVSLGMGTDMNNIISKKGFSLKGLLTISHMLSSKTNYESMSLVEKGMLHSIVMSIFGVGEGVESGKLAGAYVNKFKESAAVKDVRDLTLDISLQVGKTAVQGVWESVKWAAGFMQSSPDVGSALIAINLPIFSESTSILGKIS